MIFSTLMQSAHCLYRDKAYSLIVHYFPELSLTYVSYWKYRALITAGVVST